MRFSRLELSSFFARGSRVVHIRFFNTPHTARTHLVEMQCAFICSDIIYCDGIATVVALGKNDTHLQHQSHTCNKIRYEIAPLLEVSICIIDRFVLLRYRRSG